MGDAGRGEGLGEELGLVAGTVVGQDPFDGDAVAGEKGVGTLPEGDRGVLAFVDQDLAVGEAGVVIDRGVDVAVTDHWLAALAQVGGGLPIVVAGSSNNPRSPSVRQRRTHLWAVAREIPIPSAT